MIVTAAASPAIPDSLSDVAHLDYTDADSSISSFAWSSEISGISVLRKVNRKIARTRDKANNGVRYFGRCGLWQPRSCPVEWCSWRRVTAMTGMGRTGQPAIAGRLTAGSSLKGAIVSRVM